MNFVFATGGTGGHIFPAVAVAEALLERNPAHRIVFVGTGRELERRLLKSYQYRSVAAVPITGRGLSGLISLVRKTPSTLREISQLFNEIKPDVVVGFGGYPSFFPVACAQLNRIPTAIQEQNASLGLANRVLCRFAKVIFLGPDAAAPKKYLFKLGRLVRVKNPVRKIFYSATELLNSAFSKNHRPLTLLILGGSQGAMRLNSAIAALVPLWRRLGVSIIHQAGERDRERVAKLYKDSNFSEVTVVDFISEINLAYNAAHLVICRAGALTVAEVEAACRPAIFVPLPIARAHQAENVRGALRDGWGTLVEEGEAFDVRLGNEVERLLTRPELLEEMAQRSANSRERAVDGAVARPADVVASELEGF